MTMQPSDQNLCLGGVKIRSKEESIGFKNVNDIGKDNSVLFDDTIDKDNDMDTYIYTSRNSQPLVMWMYSHIKNRATCERAYSQKHRIDNKPSKFKKTASDRVESNLDFSGHSENLTYRSFGKETPRVDKMGRSQQSLQFTKQNCHGVTKNSVGKTTENSNDNRTRNERRERGFTPLQNSDEHSISSSSATTPRHKGDSKEHFDNYGKSVKHHVSYSTHDKGKTRLKETTRPKINYKTNGKRFSVSRQSKHSFVWDHSKKAGSMNGFLFQPT